MLKVKYCDLNNALVKQSRKIPHPPVTIRLPKKTGRVSVNGLIDIFGK